MLEKAKWIWTEKTWLEDEYATFVCNVEGKVGVLEIAAEGNYAAYVNGKLAAFGQYPGYPDEKYADTVDLGEFLGEEENTLEIVVWYHGADTAGYIDDGAGVIFQVKAGERLLAKSGKHILSCRENRYKNGYKKRISAQLGYSFLYDPTVTKEAFSPSVELVKTQNIFPRPVKKLRVGEPIRAKLVRSGDGAYLFDLGAETAGQLYLDVFSSVKQTLLIAYGEHIEDGCVRRKMGGRDFSVEYVAPAGRSTYVNPFRRLGCRYLEVFAEKEVELFSVTLLPTDYPLKKLPFTADSPLRQRIYDVACDTLRLCRHEHYEDCPWREQALYTFDSRNEMLAEYYATGGYEFARANLSLIAKGVRKDGLLELTYPARNTPAIPMFSLIYPIQVCEYVAHSGDETILNEVLPIVDGIMGNFRARAKNGLIADFPAPYWNFYEWGNESDNAHELSRKPTDGYERRYSLILNCMYVYAETHYARLVGKASVDTEGFKKRIYETFYDEKKGLFRAYAGDEVYTEFGNALAILIGLGDEAAAEKLIAGEALPVTLSAAAFYFDALLTFGKKYEDFVLQKIDGDYAYMLSKGATSFWETIEGAGPIGEAGSLCHAWSALPVYYYAILKKGKYDRQV